MSEVRHVSHELLPRIGQAVKEAALGEDVFWDAMPTQVQQADGLIVGYAIVFWIRGAEVGTMLSGVLMMSNPIDILVREDGSGEKRLREAVTNFLNNMVARRSAELAPNNGHGKPAGPSILGG